MRSDRFDYALKSTENNKLNIGKTSDTLVKLMPEKIVTSIDIYLFIRFRFGLF